VTAVATVGDPVRRAWATLGLPPGTPEADLRRHYKSLVRRWHPDRFVSQPDLQARAAVTMQAINDAYRTVRSTPPARTEPPPHASPRPAGPVGGPVPKEAPRRTPDGPRAPRWDRRDIDAMIDAINERQRWKWSVDPAPLDWLHGFVVVAAILIRVAITFLR